MKYARNHSSIFLCLLVLAVVAFTAATTRQRGINRHIKIVNESGTKVQVYWIHPQTRDASLMSDPHVVVGAEFPLESYVGHEFEVRELADANTGECTKSADKVCRQTYFKVTDNDEQVAKITADFQTEFIDNKIKAELQASDLIKKCQASAKQKLVEAGTDTDKASAAVDELLACVEGGVATALERVNEEIAFQASVRKDIAATLENYTCVDDMLNSTADISTTTWLNSESENDKEPYTVHVKHERPASKIHVIENFILDDECTAMEEQAASTLHHATVADGKGGSRLSDNRKAMQAGIKVPWDQPDHPIARLSRRVYDYTNHVLGLGIDEHGQEDLMSIQYFGRGRNDTEPDRYTPHCDGDCTGQPHKSGTRMATMVMYCKTAEAGGHTNFRNAGVHVKPVPNAAIFFSYIDPATLTMDTGFTEHSGCPVFEGEKKIVTQWIRLGVTDEEPWTAFNTLGIKLSELEE
jgi:2OG-Fe(II) oxygenase superfamily